MRAIRNWLFRPYANFGWKKSPGQVTLHVNAGIVNFEWENIRTICLCAVECSDHIYYTDQQTGAYSADYFE